MPKKSGYIALNQREKRRADPFTDPPFSEDKGDPATESSVLIDPVADVTDSSSSSFDSFGTFQHFVREDEEDFSSCAEFEDFDLPPAYFDVISTLSLDQQKLPGAQISQEACLEEKQQLLEGVSAELSTSSANASNRGDDQFQAQSSSSSLQERPLIGVNPVQCPKHRRVSDATSATVTETDCSPAPQSCSSSRSASTLVEGQNSVALAEFAVFDHRPIDSMSETLPISPVSSIANKIQVAVRVRPLLGSELVDRKLRPTQTSPWKVRSVDVTPSNRCLELQHPHTSSDVYYLDRVFDETVSTQEIHDQVTRPLVLAVVDGRHATILAYGQTGSGKTHTMQGSNAGDLKSESRGPGGAGIIELAATDLFRCIESRGSKRKFSVKAQYFEIYNEQIRDLFREYTFLPLSSSSRSLLDAAASLKEGQDVADAEVSSCNERQDDVADLFNSKASLLNSHRTNSSYSGSRSEVRRFGARLARTGNRSSGNLSPRRLLRHVVSKATPAKQNPFHNQVLQVREEDGLPVVNAVEIEVFSVEDVLQLLDEGAQNRAIGSTSANQRSSRSHAIFRLTVESYERDTTGAAKLVSVLNLVDLAGSENAHRSGATGLRRREGGAINQSLLSLSRVIHALSLPEKKRPKHINYRDSKLTRILQPHLSGNACMAFLCCISPSVDKVEESRSTLKFATSAKQVKITPVVNAVVDHCTMVKALRCELAKAKQELQSLQCYLAAGESPLAIAAKTKGFPDESPSQSVWSNSQGLVDVAFDASDNRVERPCKDCRDGRCEAPKSRRDTWNESIQGLDFSDLLDSEQVRHPIQEVVLVDEALTAPFPPTSQSVKTRQSEVFLTMCAPQCDSDTRAKFLEEKLSATDKLVETLFRDLEASNRSNAELEAQVDSLRNQVAHLEASRSGDIDLERMRLIKTTFYAAAVFYVTNQPNLFMATVMFLSLSLESSTKETSE